MTVRCISPETMLQATRCARGERADFSFLCNSGLSGAPGSQMSRFSATPAKPLISG